MDQKKRGRPKGSKNRPKEVEEVSTSKEICEFPAIITNKWREENGYLLEVTNLDYPSNPNDKTKTLLGFVEGYGDWDFGLKFPFFAGKILKWDNKTHFPKIREERIDKAYVTLSSEKKPKRLYLMGRQLIDSNTYSPEITVVFYFGIWGEESEWMEP